MSSTGHLISASAPPQRIPSATRVVHDKVAYVLRRNDAENVVAAELDEFISAR
ncbi:hypothetical protein M1247_36295 [Mycobacterium sp. 21AC1]|uniref:hypothetical protein n=1 Tax=[Mycobacterium] appelbergii TaxID=2939269 RepID=UPI002938FCD0|nr:hypothetical protein [Mycobacterium sp. 21AC1]MDV3130410.1 hypothetical protein [Mycobacterium sp. 21AC1]